MGAKYPKVNIIGGKFGLPVELGCQETNPIFLQGEPILLFNARSGIRVVVDFLRPKNVWLPSFLCKTIVSAAKNGKTNLKFYPINLDLKVSSTEFLEQVQPGDLFLFIDYFGFPFDELPILELKNLGAIIFRDCCQALFFDWIRGKSDFYLYSPRKFLGVPDGGLLQLNPNMNFKIPDLLRPPQEYLYQLFCAIVLRREFDVFGGERKWNELFHRGEEGFKTGNFLMSELSHILLKFAFDYEKIALRRIENYNILRSKLKALAIYPEIPQNVVPLGFPVKLDDRDTVQEYLFKKNIFPPIHWQINGVVPEEFSESHQLASHIMTLPCDHRYDIDDMEYLADCVEKAVF
jgi:hypothetical protein